MATAKKNNNMLYGGIAVLTIGGILLMSNSASAKTPAGGEIFNDVPKGDAPKPKPQVSPKPVVVALNENLLLQKGSKNLETKKLQTLLGITADGVFGLETEAALKAKKGLISITLAKFKTTPDVNNNSYPKGTKVMSNNRNGTKVYINETLANGINQSTGEIFRVVDYGQALGTVEAASAGAVWYRIKYLGVFAWVSYKDVINY